MKRSQVLAVVLVLLVGAGYGGTVYAGSVYVASAQARILAEPRFGAAVVATVPRGAELAVAAEGSRWKRVSWQDRVGWVPCLVVATEPPLEPLSELETADVELERSARRRASATVGAGASRGLVADGRRRLAQGEDSDHAALARLEAFTVSPAEVREFAAAVAP